MALNQEKFARKGKGDQFKLLFFSKKLELDGLVSDIFNLDMKKETVTVKSKLILLGLILLLGAIFLIYSGESAIAHTDQPVVAPVDQIIVKYKDAANLNQAAQAQTSIQMERLSSAAGITIEYFRPMSGEAHVMRLPERMPIDQVLVITKLLSTLPEVEYAEPDYMMFPLGETINTPLVTPNDPQYSNQWHYFAPTPGNYGVNAPDAWDITTGSSGIYVAVLDTGITDHSDLSGRWLGGYDMISEPLIGNDSDGRDSDPHDPGDWITSAESNESGGFFEGCRVTNSSWHGTHVAGTIGAATNNSTGVAGLNWVSQVIPVRVLGKCGGYSSDIADGITWAAGLPVSGVPTNPNPAQVINMSLGGSGTCSTTYQNAVNGAYGAGAVVVVAAGNSAADAGGYQPASCNNVITVASNDRYGDLAYYSNYGATVEITAPGGETTISSEGVLSTLNSGTQGPSTESYDYYQGTSMAAPHIAGVASLMMSLDPALTPAEVLSYMQSTVTAFPGGSSCNTSNCGSGIVNAAAVLAAVGNTGPDAPALSPINNPDGDGSYTVSWGAVSFAAQVEDDFTDTPLSVTDVYSVYLPLVMKNVGTTYTLQEDDNAAFTSPTVVYEGSNTSWGATGKVDGTYYYRVMASNLSGDLIWSNIQSVTVNTGGGTGIVNGNFESGSTGWTEFSTHGWDIIVTNFPGTITARSGSYAAWLGGDFDDISYVQQQVTISPSTPYLIYYHWIASEDTCGWDFGGVLVNGAPVDVYDLCDSEDTGGWVKHSVNLSAFAGQLVTIQIRAETDASLNSNLLIDDVSLQASALASEQIDDSVQNLDVLNAKDKIGIIVQNEKQQRYNEQRLLNPK